MAGNFTACTVDGFEGKEYMQIVWKVGTFSYNHWQVPAHWIFKTIVSGSFKIGD